VTSQKMDRDGNQSSAGEKASKGAGGGVGGGVGGDLNNDDVPTSPMLYYASIFLIVTTLLQVLSTYQEEAGPFDWFAAMFIPRFLSLGIGGGSSDDDRGVMDGELCPSDQWLDEAFVRAPSNGLYSSKYDPRNKVQKPSLFPHCALRRWVQLEKERECPEGSEYVTVISPPNIVSEREREGKIPQIIHISSPNNCLPLATIQTLRDLVHQHISQAFTIYIHSSDTMDNFLFQREWNIFPQVKEGVLCGSGKLNMVTQLALREVKVGNNSTEQQQEIVDKISMGLKRDFWRYMVLWEYGGITMDIDTVHTILLDGSEATSLSSSNKTSHHRGYNTMRKLMHQWHSEKSDALLYFINNDDKQRLPYSQRIPLTDIMGMAPYHPLIYYSAKIALRIATWDAEKSITDTGRTTKVPPIKAGLQHISRGWGNIKTGDVMNIENENKNSIHFINGDEILPQSLSSPRISPWRSIFAAFKSFSGNNTNNKDEPSDENINLAMRNSAGEQKYIPQGLFSCMEYTLDMYLQKKTNKN